MADTTLSPTGLTQIEVGASDDTWGAKLNANAATVNDLFDDVGGDPALSVSHGGTGAKTAAAARASLGAAAATGGTISARVAFAPGSTLTVASDVVTVTGSYHLLDTEGAAASDNLATINGGTEFGQMLILRPASGVRVVTVQDNVGNLQLSGNFVPSSISSTLTLIYIGTFWVEVSRSQN